MGTNDVAASSRGRRIVVAAIVIAAVGGAAGYALAVTPQHRATATVYLSSQSITAAPDLGTGRTYAQQAAAAYADLARSPLVLHAVIADLHLRTTPDQLAKRVSTSVPSDTVLIDITAAGDSTRESAVLADAVSRELVRVSSSVMPSGGAAHLHLTVVKSARSSG